MSTITISRQITFAMEECCKCGVVFGVSAYYQQRRQELGDDFYCPNGHAQSYAKSEAQVLREQLEKTKGKLANAEFEVMTTRRRAETAEANLNKIKSRLHGGICPCCGRRFAALSRHMKAKHPDFSPVA